MGKLIMQKVTCNNHIKKILYLTSLFVMSLIMMAPSESLASSKKFDIYLKNGRILQDYQLYKSADNPNIIIAKKGENQIEINKSAIRKYDQTNKTFTTINPKTESERELFCLEVVQDCEQNPFSNNKSFSSRICGEISSHCEYGVQRGTSTSSIGPRTYISARTFLEAVPAFKEAYLANLVCFADSSNEIMKQKCRMISSERIKKLNYRYKTRF